MRRFSRWVALLAAAPGFPLARQRSYGRSRETGCGPSKDFADFVRPKPSKLERHGLNEGCEMTLSRRALLERCTAFGVLSFVGPLALGDVAEAWAAADAKRLPPTPSCALGPFYRRLAPSSANLRSEKDPGFPLAIAGMVYSVSGEVLPNANVEVWQADHLGHYDIEGFRFRATLVADSKGTYAFKSVMPGHYPGRVCQHVHYLVTAPEHKPMVTQLYFGTDPVFEGNPQKNFSRDSLITSIELVRPVIIKGDPQEMMAAVNFDVVLEKQ